MWTSHENSLEATTNNDLVIYIDHTVDYTRRVSLRDEGIDVGNQSRAGRIMAGNRLTELDHLINNGKRYNVSNIPNIDGRRPTLNMHVE
jgi:hypothetical protein